MCEIRCNATSFGAKTFIVMPLGLRRGGLAAGGAAAAPGGRRNGQTRIGEGMEYCDEGTKQTSRNSCGRAPNRTNPC